MFYSERCLVNLLTQHIDHHYFSCLQTKVKLCLMCYVTLVTDTWLVTLVTDTWLVTLVTDTWLVTLVTDTWLVWNRFSSVDH